MHPGVRKVMFLVLCRGRECTYCQWAGAAATATLSRGTNTHNPVRIWFLHPAFKRLSNVCSVTPSSHIEVLCVLLESHERFNF
jgi:hypothetical protein